MLRKVRVLLRLASLRHITTRQTLVKRALSLQVPMQVVWLACRYSLRSRVQPWFSRPHLSRKLQTVIILWPISVTKWPRIVCLRSQLTKLKQHHLSRSKDRNHKRKPISRTIAGLITIITVIIKISTSRQVYNRVQWTTRIKWHQIIAKAMRLCFSARLEVLRALPNLNSKMIKIDIGHLNKQLAKMHLLLVNLPRISNTNYRNKKLLIDLKARVLARNLLGVSRIWKSYLNAIGKA